MRFTFTDTRVPLCALGTFLLLLLCSLTVSAQRLPYEIVNNSEFPDNEVFVAIVGEELPGGKFIWVDAATGQINRMSREDNTVPGPIIGGNRGPGLDGRYANCFRRLSEIPNSTLAIPQIAGCRILISFWSQLYLYFFGYDGDPRGYAGANLENPTDPNQGITFEVIELTYNEFGIFNNTSRVDAFQYPIGLEVTGDNFFKKVGELKTREEIFNEWERTAPAAFRGLLDRERGIISFPTKSETFPKDYLDGYISAIWNKYRRDEIFFNSGDAGLWRGRVQGNNFVFRRESDGQIATISGIPSTLEAMEGSGIMATGQRWDLVIQAQFVAAITRHAIDLSTASGEFQDFGDASRYYQIEPYNWYAKFLHRTDISFEGQTYAFAYDDVFDQSATIATGSPRRAKITLGPISGGSTPPPPSSNGVVTFYKDCPFTGSSVALPEGKYTLTQLRARGIQNDDISSVRVQPGFQVELFRDNDFAGGSIVVTGDADCLVSRNFNDETSSIRISKTGGGAVLRIEAEDFTEASGIQVEPSTESGDNIGYTDPGDFLVYGDVTFPVAGNYTFKYRVASATGGGRFSTDFDAGTTVLGETSVPSTGGWQDWTTVTQTYNVAAGTYALGIYTLASGWNLNWIEISGPGNVTFGGGKTVGLFNPQVREEQATLSPNPFTEAISFSTDGTDIDVKILDLQGRGLLFIPRVSNGTRVDLSHLPKGAYLVQTIRDGVQGKLQRIVKH